MTSLIPLAFADIGKDLDNYFNDLGYSANITNPQSFHGQQAGYYTGGSVSARTKVRDVQIVQVTLPSYRSGCGGIDFFGGSLSILNKEELKKTFKAVLNNTTNVAATLAIETISPLIAKNAKEWKSYIDQINQFSLNSCEMAEGLVGGVWSKMRSSQQHMCEDVASQNNIYSSWTEARQGCGYDTSRAKDIDAVAKNDPSVKDMLFKEGNIVWKALQKRSFLYSDTELAELFMSLSGTIVITNDGGKVQYKPFPTLSDQADLVNALLKGGDATIYRCDETVSCLYPQAIRKNISPKMAFQKRVADTLNSIARKVKNDTALNEGEQSLIAATSLPVLRMITVNGAYLKEGNIPDTDAYAEVIATDILYQYLYEALSIVRVSVGMLSNQADLETKIESGIRDAMANLSKKKELLARQVAINIQMIEQTQAIERMLVGEFSTQLAGTLSWAKGLN